MGVPKMKSHAVCPPGAFYSSGRTQVEVNGAGPCHRWTADLLCICSLFWRWQSKFYPQVIPWPLAHVRWGLAGQGPGRQIDTGPARQNTLSAVLSLECYASGQDKVIRWDMGLYLDPIQEE